MIEIRRMDAAELTRIGEIDRSEHTTVQYVYRDGTLSSRPFEFDVPKWSPSGDHEHSVPARIRAWRPLLERGATLLGAFDAAALAGFAIYRPRLAEDMGNLAALFVSRSHRRRGVAQLLTDEVARLARADDARRLYVSATPSDSAIGFYRSCGFVPTDTPDPAMLALEPEDIHMILAL